MHTVCRPRAVDGGSSRAAALVAMVSSEPPARWVAVAAECRRRCAPWLGGFGISARFGAMSFGRRHAPGNVPYDCQLYSSIG
jgi:hypothetical protein